MQKQLLKVQASKAAIFSCRAITINLEEHNNKITDCSQWFNLYRSTFSTLFYNYACADVVFGKRTVVLPIIEYHLIQGK